MLLRDIFAECQEPRCKSLVRLQLNGHVAAEKIAEKTRRVNSCVWFFWFGAVMFALTLFVAYVIYLNYMFDEYCNYYIPCDKPFTTSYVNTTTHITERYYSND